MEGAGRGSAPAPPGIAWSWPDAALGAVYALPAAIVVANDPQQGLGLSVGVLPAAILGLAATRRERRRVVVLGVLTGLPVLLGGLLAGVPVLAVAGIALLSVGAVLLAQRSRIGLVAMTLSLPMVGVGLSYSDVGDAAGIAGLIVAGSLFAYLVTLPLPERTPLAAAGRMAAQPPTLAYGARLGAAAASAAAIGFLLDFEHVGWACAAALLVMRPAQDMQRLRSVGRVLAVAIGALAAIALVRLDPPAGAYAAATVLALAAAAATHASRWYVTSAFTTYLVFLLLLYANPDAAGARFAERLSETLLGVGLAYLFGLALPALRRRRAAA